MEATSFRSTDAYLRDTRPGTVAPRERPCVRAVRISLGVIFAWFGVLKFFPGVSPAESLAVDTLEALTLGAIAPRILILALALFESALGLLLLSGKWTRTAIALLWAHMAGTALPLLLFPRRLFTAFPYAPTLEGQYILKNLIVVAAALVVWHEAAARRGSRILGTARVRGLHTRGD
jgi:uncharacterized membrane protein YkgB